MNFELCCLARILLLESQQGSTRNEFRTLLPCQNFRPQLAQRDRLKAGFESFKAMDCGKTKMSQDEAGSRLQSNSRAGHNLFLVLLFCVWSTVAHGFEQNLDTSGCLWTSCQTVWNCLEALSLELDLFVVLWTSLQFRLSGVCLVSVLGGVCGLLETGGSSWEGLAKTCNWIGGSSKCCIGDVLAVSWMMLHAQLPMGGL